MTLALYQTATIVSNSTWCAWKKARYAPSPRSSSLKLFHPFPLPVHRLIKHPSAQQTRILLAAVHAVEAEFWGHVAQKMQNAGTQRFQREFLVKTWSELKSKAQAGNMSVDIYVEHVDGGALRSTPELGEHDAEEEKAGDEKVERQLWVGFSFHALLLVETEEVLIFGCVVGED